MNAIQLKNSILQYAMTGKLVDNIEDTGFKKIWDKEVLSNKKVNQILPEEVPFDIPSTWVWARISDLGVVRTGNTPSTSNIEYYNDKYIPFIKPGDFNEGTLNYDNEYLSEKGAEKARLIEANSILMVCIGGSRGKCAYNDREVACNQQINTLSVNSNLINMQYIFYIMQSHYFQNLMIERATGTATPIVNKTNWSNFIVPVAPLEEQLIIVEKIDELFLKIKEYENSYQDLEDLNNRFPIDLEKSVLQYAMQGKLANQNTNDEPAQRLIEKIQLEKERLIKEKVIKREKPLPPITAEEVPFDIPSSWEWVRLGEISQLINGDRGKNYPSKQYWIEQGVPFINAGALGEKYLMESKLNYISEERYNLLRAGFVEKGDLIYCLRGSLGKVSLNKDIEKGAIASSVVIIRPSSLVNRYFLLLVLKSPLGKLMIERVENGTAQPNISANNMKNYLIPLPPLNEQNLIVKSLDQFQQVITKLIK